MEEMLRAGLHEGEQILWRGKPEQFETLDKTHKKGFMIKAGIGLLITVLLSVAYFVAAAKSGATPKFVVVLIVLVLCGIPAFNVLGDASKLKKMEYVATNERLIVMRDSLKAMDYSAIQEAEYRTDADGHVSLICGDEALKARQDKWREICVVGQSATEAMDHCTRFVFYAPTDLKALKTVLKDRIPVK